MSDSGRMDAGDVRRRTVLSGLGVAATGGLVLGEAARAGGRVASLRSPDLPTWTQTEQYEDVTTKFGGTNRSVVLDRRRAVVTRTISQVNMKLWDDDDVVATECSSSGTRSVGQQHRFVATTRVATLEELPLSYYHTLGYDLDRRSRNVAEPIRVPVSRGLHAQDRLKTDVSVGSSPCSSVTLRINAVDDRRIPAGQFSPDSALLTDDEFGYDAGDLAADVRRYADRSDPSPYMPDSRKGLSGVAQGVLGDVGAGSASAAAALDTAQKVGVSPTGAVEDLASASGRVGRLKRLSGAIGDKASYAGLVLSGYDVLNALGGGTGGVDRYLDEYDWSDDRVVAASVNSNAGVAVQFVDFTVTVPPGTAGGDGLTIELSQEVSVGDLVPDEGKYQLVTETQGVSADDELMGTMTWEIEVPSYDTSDVRSVSETPTAYVVPDASSGSARTSSHLGSAATDGASVLYDEAVAGDHRAAFASAPVPEFDVSLSATSIEETDSIAFSVDDYEDEGGASYRWRVYKLGGVTRPYVHYGRSGEIGRDVLSRTATAADPTIHAFGPGAYAAELTVRNGYGRVGRSAAGFEVLPRSDGVSGTEIALDSAMETVSVGDSLEVDVSGTVGRDGTPESLDRVEWLLQYPATVAGGVRNRRARLEANDGFDAAFDPPFDLRSVAANRPDEPPKTTFEHTFEHQGTYRLSVVAFSVDGDDQVRNVYYDERDPTMADKRDLSVVVVDE